MIGYDETFNFILGVNSPGSLGVELEVSRLLSCKQEKLRDDGRKRETVTFL